MDKKILEFSNFTINENGSIDEAMKAITDNKCGAVIVIDDGLIFKGVASDGDIRRGLVRGATPLAPVFKVMNANAVVLTAQNIDSAEKVFRDHAGITVLPVVNDSNQLIDVVVRAVGPKE